MMFSLELKIAVIRYKANLDFSRKTLVCQCKQVTGFLICFLQERMGMTKGADTHHSTNIS